MHDTEIKHMENGFLKTMNHHDFEREENIVGLKDKKP
jgi:hypothetical protein